VLSSRSGQPHAHVSHAASLATALARGYNEGADNAVTVTWLNHFTVTHASPDVLRRFDVVGIDGTLLQLLLRSSIRTSADLVVPPLLQQLRGARVLTIGGRTTLPQTRQALEVFCANGTRIASMIDGYSGLLRGRALSAFIEAEKCDVVLIGLGASLQDQVALEAAAASTVRLALTCGGFLDQVAFPRYYPRWAYPLRLNWLVRVWREPKRLWRRYTFSAFRVALSREQYRWVTSLAGYLAAEQLVSRAQIASDDRANKSL
jgi:beta-1,4-glucosyltransferase